jgi:hypothetical protein
VQAQPVAQAQLLAAAHVVQDQLRAQLAAAQKKGAKQRAQLRAEHQEKCAKLRAEGAKVRAETTDRLARWRAKHKQSSDALKMKHNDAILSAERARAQVKTAREESTSQAASARDAILSAKQLQAQLQTAREESASQAASARHDIQALSTVEKQLRAELAANRKGSAEKLAELRAEHKQATDALGLQHEDALGLAAGVSRAFEEQLRTTRAQLAASQKELQQLRTRLQEYVATAHDQRDSAPAAVAASGQLREVRGKMVEMADAASKQKASGAVSDGAGAVAEASAGVPTGHLACPLSSGVPTGLITGVPTECWPIGVITGVPTEPSRPHYAQRGSAATPTSLAQQRLQPPPPPQQPQPQPQASRPLPFEAGLRTAVALPFELSSLEAGQFRQCHAREQWMQVASGDNAIYGANTDHSTLVTPEHHRGSTIKAEMPLN